MRRIPKEIRVGRALWTVQRVPRSEIEGNDGLCDSETRTISVAKEVKGIVAYQVFEHEHWHARFQESGASAYLVAHVPDADKHEEIMVEMLERLER